MQNFFRIKNNFNVKEYHSILCKKFPEFLKKYIQVPCVRRLSGVGLLCGTDWTALYKNRFFYSRLDHSIGCALITWNFTKDKVQTLSSLFHDIATPCFSHVGDFRKGDALTQTACENGTEKIIRSSKELQSLLKQDGIKTEDVSDYHKYPICDNEIPFLSADRLEYMFPSGAALHGVWSLKQIKKVYSCVKVLKNEEGQAELGFSCKKAALEYFRKFLKTSHLLQLNENKLTLQLLCEICNLAVKQKIVTEEDFFNLSEKEVIELFKNVQNAEFKKLFNTFLNMKKVLHTFSPVKDSFCVNLKVKLRYINPLVEQKDGTAIRLSEVSKFAKKSITRFLNFKDTPYGCVKFISIK